MVRCLSITVGVWVLLSTSTLSAEDFVSKILEYFPGKWEAKSDNGGYNGTVDWKLVAGGKGVAGSSTFVDGVKSFALAGWDPSKEKWVHSWFSGDGSCGYLEISKFEKDTFIGQGYSIDSKGEKLSGEWRNRIVDQDHFEISQEAPGGPIVSRWRRIREDGPAGKQPATSVPKTAIQQMQYRVGKWESVGYVNGKRVEELGYETTGWIPGRHAIRITGSFVEEGTRIYAGAVVGWDAEKKQLVEHWYSSDGGYATFCYDLGKEKNAWVGTFKWVYGDGRKSEGPSRVDKKGRDEWEWNASCESNGQKLTWRTVNRRVK